MKFLPLASFIAAATLSVSVNAQTGANVSFDHVGLQYMTQNLDEWDCDQDGLNLYGSMDIRNGWYVRGNLTDVSGDYDCGSRTVAFGGGYHTRFNDSFQMYGSVSFESISPDLGDSDSGMVLAAGLRGFFSPELEAKFEVLHSTTFDGTSEFNAGLAYWFSSQFAGTLDAGIGSDTSTFAIGGRLNF